MLINFGVLEYWSVGVMAKGLMSFISTPILHHSSAPGPRLSRIFGNLEIIFLSHIVPRYYISNQVRNTPFAWQGLIPMMHKQHQAGK